MNLDEARRCIRLSQDHFQRENIEQALKLAQKSLNLHETEEGIRWLKELESKVSSGNSTPRKPDRAAADLRKRKGGQEQASTTTTTSSTESLQREYTQEQVEAVRRVKACGQDYYAILGVTREVTSSELKKSYRKMALQFHPDKNAAPGAGEAFKMISQSFTVLNDENKRRIYDTHGIRGLQRGGGRSSPDPDMHAGNAYGMQFDSEISPEDLFNMFFGAMGPGATSFHSNMFTLGPDGRPRFARQRFRQRRQEEPSHTMNVSSIASFIQLIPLLMILFISLISSLFSTKDPSFSFTPSRDHVHLYFTTHLKVQYYVNPTEFNGFMSSSSQRLPAFERHIEETYVSHLQRECLNERNERNRRIQRAKWFGADDALKAAQNYPMASCAALKELQETGQARPRS